MSDPTDRISDVQREIHHINWKLEVDEKVDREVEVNEKDKEEPEGTGSFIVRCTEPYTTTRGRTTWGNFFHQVDLGKGEVHLNSLPSIICTNMYDGDILSLDSKIYLIDGMKALPEDCPPPPADLHVFLGASCVDRSHSNKWESIAQTPYDYTALFCSSVSLCGKIYCFGKGTFFPAVYDPCAGQWNELQLSLPSGIDNHSIISRPVLLDLDNKRILVKLQRSRKLFALCLHDNGGDGKAEWKLITDKLQCDWAAAEAVADNIIYFYTDPYSGPLGTVSAYDIAEENWLTCVWSPCNAQFCFLKNISSCPGNKEIMYLVGAVPIEDGHLYAGFLKFRVKRVGNSMLQLKAISYQSFKFPSASYVRDFLAF